MSATNRGERGEGSIEEVLSGVARWCVVEADCLQVLPTLPEKSVDHVITDPPYEAEAHTLQRRVKREGGGGDFGVAAVSPLDFPPITEAERTQSAAGAIRASRGWFLAFCQAEGISAWRACMTAAGAKWRRAGIWVKPDAMPQLTGDRWATGYEAIASAWCGAGRSVWNGGGRSGVFTYLKQDTKRPNDHQTQKPLSLIVELVELFTDPDEIILDPFAGSGTTGVACLRLGRRAILIEKSGKYAALARERMRAEEQGLTLRDARAGQLPLLAGV